MDRTIVETQEAPRAIGPYSQGVEVSIAPQGSSLVLVTAGQIPLDPAAMELVPGGVAEQTERALRNVEAILAARRVTLAQVFKTTVFLLDMADFAAMNEVYARFFPTAPPARTTVAVVGLPKGARVEIEAWAAR